MRIRYAVLWRGFHFFPRAFIEKRFDVTVSASVNTSAASHQPREFGSQLPCPIHIWEFNANSSDIPGWKNVSPACTPANTPMRMPTSFRNGMSVLRNFEPEIDESGERNMIASKRRRAQEPVSLISHGKNDRKVVANARTRTALDMVPLRLETKTVTGDNAASNEATALERSATDADILENLKKRGNHTHARVHGKSAKFESGT